MSKIRILPEQLANQIAAGEVVERPASVVKELLENSLDAGADRVEIEIEGGGTRLIRIIDNGEGMDEDDLLLSLERHGTSKIKTQEDLGAIGTLGFRGEAVPSIGSVSQMTITSRPEQAELGTSVVLHFGKLSKVHESGCSFGTTVEVRNLFGNTPARRKFLRTARTELGHIEEVVKNYALGSPGVTFILRLDGRDAIYLDNSLSIEQRLANIMHYDGPFIPVGKPEHTQALRRVSGFLVPPEKVTAGPSRMRLFVNGRAVRDRMILHAVTEGLRGFLMKGKNPSGLIHLTLPPEEVDVNVHPAKHEVRFRNSRDIHALLSQSVTDAMRAHQLAIKTAIFGPDRIQERTRFPSDSKPEHPPSFASPDYSTELPDDHLSQRRQDSPSGAVNTRRSTPVREKSLSSNVRAPDPVQPLFVTAEPMQRLSSEPETVPVQRDNHQQDKRAVGHNLIIVGQYDDLYIFCKTSEGLLVIDQHAAHERLLYEKLRKQYLANTVVRQTLMFPETVELSIFQAQLVEKNEEEIDRIGFSIREFGGNTYIISAVPALAGLANGRELFLDILEQFGSESSKGDTGGYLDTILATMACKAAVKAGTKLSNPEIDTLLNEMTRADLFSHCPHGRPVVKLFTRDEVKKWFYRT
ncbi:DNA mismatch repair endonuclease MutL [Desulfopila sp. IMCC35006]|uniref:DNA mismatch repair endonuclease MutL n=1 Tax=Desulfopila sp. IMCC35006 TaxID=2569542 RepID=UPI0010AC1EA7|nr:DNA mismatch repair endonuclease MutL [Desulfopila sp. IMCC35006]TKB26676.1 DNA mismatch repair endonuclease MutL [Desulfopila sp. IMCC35006]